MLCVWTDAPQETPLITSVYPEEISVGTEVAITGCGFGSSEPEMLLSPATSGGSTVALDVVAFRQSRIVARLNSGAAPGLYDLNVNVARGQGSAVVARESVMVRLPSDLGFDPEFVEVDTVVTMTGRFLGSQEGQIAMFSQAEPLAGKLDAQVISWENNISGGSDNDNGTGARGKVVFAVPSLLPTNGFYDVEVTNAVGSVIAEAALVAVGVVRASPPSS